MEFADKLVAFALSPNRIKNRDLWDIAWLTQQGVKLPVELVLKKLADHKQKSSGFMSQLAARKSELLEHDALERAFQHEMIRFLPPEITRQTVEAEGFFTYVRQTVGAACDLVLSDTESSGFRM